MAEGHCDPALWPGGGMVGMPPPLPVKGPQLTNLLPHLVDSIVIASDEPPKGPETFLRLGDTPCLGNLQEVETCDADRRKRSRAR